MKKIIFQKIYMNLLFIDISPKYKRGQASRLSIKQKGRATLLF